MPSRELLSAVKQGDKEKVLHALLAAGDVSIDFLDNDDKTALIYAVQNADVDIITLLIKYRANLDWPGQDYYSYYCKKDRRPPLIHAVQSGNEEIVNLLIHSGADVNKSDENGKPALFYAVQQNDEVLTRLLIQTAIDSDGSNEDNCESDGNNEHKTGLLAVQSVSGVDVNKTDRFGKTALMYAVQNQNINIINLLIKSNADVNKVGSSSSCSNVTDGKSALIHAVDTKNTFITQILISSGADVNQTDSSGKTALFYAVEYCHEEIVQILINAHADVDITDINGQTALFFATKCDNKKVKRDVRKYLSTDYSKRAALVTKLNIAKTLIAAKANLNVANNDGKTALFYAVEKGNAAMTQELIAKKADVNIVDKAGKTVLIYAVQNEYKDIINLLIKFNADVNKVGDSSTCSYHSVTDGKSALIHAVDTKNTEITQVLIGSGADVNQTDSSGKTALFYAFEQNSKVLTELLIQAKISVNKVDASGKTALFYAVRSCHKEIVQSLINAKANVNITDNKGQTALFFATQCDIKMDTKNSEITQVLISSGADVNQTDSSGKTALFYAVKYFHDEIAQTLINAHADVNIVDKEGKTALFYAVEKNNAQMTRDLILANTDVNIMDNQHKTALFYAVVREEGQDLQLTQTLIKGGVDVNIKDVEGKTALFHIVTNTNQCAPSLVPVLRDAEASDFNVADNQGRTALIYAIQHGKYEIAETLTMEEGIDVNIADNEGKTALIYAAEQLGQKRKKRKGQDKNITEISDIIHTLLDFGADVNVTDKEGRTALHFAVISGKDEIVDVLIKADIDVNTADDKGKTALIYAVDLRKVNISRLLIGAGADVNIADNEGNAALHFAVLCGKGVVDILIKAGADVNTTDNKGKTALIYAVDLGKVNISLLLIDARADVNVADKGGKTALFYARRRRNDKIADALLDAGANVNILDNEGKTPLFYACESRYLYQCHPRFIDATTVDQRDKEGKTALFYSLQHGNEFMTHHILKAGADINVIDNEGRTPLFYACKVHCISELINAQTVNQVDKQGETALIAAARQYGKEEIACRIVDGGGDVNAIDNEGQTPLVHAVHSQKIKLTRALIEKRCDVNVSDKYGETVLITAVSQRYSNEIALELINAGANVNAVDRKGKAPIAYAVERDTSDMMQVVNALIRRGSDINANDKNGQTILMHAIQYGKEIPLAIIDSGADVDIADKCRQTALFHAVNNRNVELVRALIAKGCDVNITDKDGWTALIHAVHRRYKEIASIIIAAGADLDVADNDGRTALIHTAAVPSFYQELKTACEIIGAGADVNIKDNNGQTALFHAVDGGNVKLTQLLIEKDSDVNLIDNKGQTTLAYAIMLGEEQLCKLLISAGSDVSLLNQKEVLLFHAVKNNLLEITQHLIDQGAFIDPRDDLGRTPLFYASIKSVSITRLLLSRGANLDVKDSSNNDALSFFVDNCAVKAKIEELGISEVCQIFDEYGFGRKNIVTSILNALFHHVFCSNELSSRYNRESKLVDLVNLAAQYQDEDNPERKEAIELICKKIEVLTSNAALVDILSLLVKLGVDPNSADLHGNTALHYAACLPLCSEPQETVLEIWNLLEMSGARLNAVNHDKQTPFLFCLSKYLSSEAREGFGTMFYFYGGWRKEQIQGVVYTCKFFLKDDSSLNQVSSQGDSFFHYIMRIFQKFFARQYSFNTFHTKKIPYQEPSQLMHLLQETDNKKLEKSARRPNDKLETPLHIWATLTHENEEVPSETFEKLMSMLLEYLLKHGAKVNARNENDETPLHLCQTWCAVQLLIDAGTNVNDVDSSGRTPLLAAAVRYKQGYRERFFNDCTDDPDVFWRNAIDKGLNPWACDKDGESVLSFLLSSYKGFKLSEALVQVACDNSYCKSLKDLVTLLNAICKDMSSNNLWKENLVEMLLKVKDDKLDLNVALIHCCRNLDEHIRENSERSIKTNFAESVFWKISQRLHFYGADYSTPDSTGVSCLDIAESCPVLKYLISQPIDIEKVPIAIPWKKLTEKHRDKLAKVVRRQECKVVQHYWHHQVEIASGSFGEVFAAIDSRDGREVAVKRIVNSRMTSPRDMREIDNLISIDCQQVVRYLSYSEDENFVYIVLELMEGSLESANFLHDKSFDISKKIELCKHVLSGVEYLHDKDILHRDLKPSNILYKTKPHCLKIADFGLSRCMSNTATTVYGTNAGTRCWMAPEILKGVTPSKCSDIFSCGLVLHYILSAQKHPFASTKSALMNPCDIHKTEGNILNNKMEGWDQLLPPEVTHLLKEMLGSNDKKRPTAPQALAHPMFWSETKKMDFLVAVGNQPEFECPRSKRSSLTGVERHLEAQLVIVTKYVYRRWNDPVYVKMSKIYAEMTSKYKRRTYDTRSVVELVRFMRNAVQHVSDPSRSADVQQLVLQDFAFLEEFPNLVIEVFKAVTDHGWDHRKEIESAITK